jgi:outer membrane protein OmpA-like peptidoglycan-associated protein
MELEQKLLAGVPSQPPSPREAIQVPALSAAMPANFREVQLNIDMLPLRAGQMSTLTGVFFAPNSARLLPVSEIELQRLADAMAKHPNLGVEIIAHTHSGLCHSQALALTEARAQAAAAFLTGRGIDPGRIATRGAGKLEPAVEMETEDTLRQNQRLCVKWFNLLQ